MKCMVRSVAVVASAAIAIGAAAWVSADQPDPHLLTFRDDTGTVRTFNTAGSLDTDNPFFQSLGTNGRACVTCHQASDGWSVTPTHLRERFATSRGLDPIFSSNDGSNCEGASPASLSQRRAASSLLLTKGLIRVGLTVPLDAEFTVAAVDDPYKCGGSLDNVSAYRRVLPTTNLRFLSTVMWDGRETKPGQSIVDDLKGQAKDATLGHAQASLTPTDDEIRQIVSFEMGLFTAQATDNAAGALHAHGATGGPVVLSQQPFSGHQRSARWQSHWRCVRFASVQPLRSVDEVDTLGGRHARRRSCRNRAGPGIVQYEAHRHCWRRRLERQPGGGRELLGHLHDVS